MSNVTRILNAIEQGNTQAADELLPLVYEELRLLAAQRLSQETPGQTLQATALVHEAYIRLVGSTQQKWDGHGHFFAAAAEAMRRILIENARRKKTVKHGGNQKKVSLNGLETPFDSNPEELLALDEVLSRFTESDPKRATLLKLRYFAGMTIKQMAQCQGISEKTVFNSLAYARAWLHREIVRDGKST